MTSLEVTVLNPEYVRDGPTPVPIGFQNTGTICWMNSFCQVITGATSIRHAIEAAECDLAKNKLCIATSKMINNPTETSTAEMVAAMEKMAIDENGRRKLFSGQQCAAEAFTYFVDLLGHKEVTGRIANVYSLTATCRCGKVASDTKDISTSIVMNSSADITEENFARWLRKREVPLDGFKCSCGAEIPTRVETLKTLRECVVIVMDKFQRKDNRFFPRKFELSTTSGPMRWELIGVVEHAGAMGGGHYWAKTRRGDVEKKWYKCNDNSVAECPEPTPTEEAFMIIYHLV